MEVEIVISGLCAFHNVRDINPTMPEPSMILVRTDDEPGDNEMRAADGATPLFSPKVAQVVRERWSRSRVKINAGRRAKADERDVHIPYIAFNSNLVRVDEESEPLFRQVPRAPGFRYLQLNGVELEIENDPPAKPNVDPSYDRIVKKDDYWPEAKNDWNRDYVPERGKQPKRRAVVGFMRFGSGTIAAGKLSPVEWEFSRNGRGPHTGRFAIEGIYRDFPHSGDDIVIRLLDVETRELIRTVRFSPLNETVEKLTLFIGNADSDDIDDAVQRLVPIDVRNNNHFRFLNRVAAKKDPGRIPRVVPPRFENPPDPNLGGGVSSGPCGPTSSNG